MKVKMKASVPSTSTLTFAIHISIISYVLLPYLFPEDRYPVPLCQMSPVET